MKPPLTGLLNRRGLENAVNDLTLQAAQLKDAALLLVDVDFFKRTNHTHGHRWGRGLKSSCIELMPLCTSRNDWAEIACHPAKGRDVH